MEKYDRDRVEQVTKMYTTESDTVLLRRICGLLEVVIDKQNRQIKLLESSSVISGRF